MAPETDGVREELAGQLFAATQWSCVLRAKDNSTAALNALCATYRSALLAWLRCRGLSNDAEDLVHGFLTSLLARNFLAGISPEKGRFRTFLLTSFTNYLRDRYRQAAAEKRGGGRPLGSLDAPGSEGAGLLDRVPGGVTPDWEYDRAWAAALLTSALRRLEQECSRTGHDRLCAALEPVMFCDETAPAYAQIATRFGMSEAAVKMAAMRIRQRLRGIIREEVMQTVTNEGDLQEELGYLRSLFEREKSM